MSKASLARKIGTSIATFRRQKNIRLEDLSLLSGVGISTLSNLENGTRNVRLNTLEHILTALQVTPNEFFASLITTANEIHGPKNV